jgi:hypothetical protein
MPYKPHLKGIILPISLFIITHSKYQEINEKNNT